MQYTEKWSLASAKGCLRTHRGLGRNEIELAHGNLTLTLRFNKKMTSLVRSYVAFSAQQRVILLTVVSRLT